MFNELELETPYSFDITLPEDQFRPGIYLVEADRLFNFLMKIPRGVGLDTLVLMKDDVGLDKTTLLLAYMELRDSGRIEEYYPTGAGFQYNEGYTYIRCRGVHHSTMQGMRFKKIANEEIKKKALQSPLAKMTEAMLKKQGKLK